MTNLRRFTKVTIHTGDQSGPPSPYAGEHSHAAKVSSGTSKFPVGSARKQRAFESSNRKVNPIGVADQSTSIGWAVMTTLSRLAQVVEWTKMRKTKVNLTLIIGIDRDPFVTS